MPSQEGQDTNRFHCEFCGRYFNAQAELVEHQKECAAAHRSGKPRKPTQESGNAEGDDREWVSTP